VARLDAQYRRLTEATACGGDGLRRRRVHHSVETGHCGGSAPINILVAEALEPG